MFRTFAKNTPSVVVFTVSSMAGLAYYSKHTILLDFYKDQMLLRGNSGPANISERLQRLISEVSEDLKEYTTVGTSVVPFIVPGITTLHAGTVASRFGGIVGLPAFFEFNSEEDLNSKLLVQSSYTDSDTGDDANCHKHFLLSDEAKKYAIAREILHVNTIQVYINTALPIALTYAADIIAKMFSEDLVVKKSHFLASRGFQNLLLTVLGLALWIMLYTNVRNYYESEVELIVSQLGDKYLQGGVEYNSKCIERNSYKVELKDQQLRFFNYTSGYWHRFVSFNEIPYSHRVAYLKAHIEKNNKEKDCETTL